MCPKPLKTSFPHTVLLVIMMFILRFILRFFLVKDRATRRIIFRGECRGGLYPLESPSPHKHVFSTTTPSQDLWHRCLGHPAAPVVRHIIQSNNLLCPKVSNKMPVCDACQQAKSHQLPYTHSHEISASSLELIYSDVWGPAITSAGGFKYYVSFIDDFSKFVWFYPIKSKADVFPIFHQFQALVERQFNKKIICMQTD